jgi:hypothetical protein
MSSLAAARADNFYYPPGFDPAKHGSLNKVTSHPYSACTWLMQRQGHGLHPLSGSSALHGSCQWHHLLEQQHTCNV